MIIILKISLKKNILQEIDINMNSQSQILEKARLTPNEISYNKGRELLTRKRLYEKIRSIVNSVESEGKDTKSLNSEFRSKFKAKNWKSQTFKCPVVSGERQFKHYFYKDGVCIEVELSLSDYIFRELCRFKIGFDNKNFMVAVVITHLKKPRNYQLDFEYARDMADLLKIEFPLIIFGI